MAGLGCHIFAYLYAASLAKRQLYGNSEEIAGRSADNVVCEFLDNNLNEKRFFP